MNTKALLEPMGSWAWWRSWFLIFLGCSVMGAGFVLFVNPYKFVPGGVYGMGIVLHNIFPSVQVGTFGYMFDIPLMLISMLVFGGGFGTRTVLAALYTPGFMNVLTRLVYPNPEAVESLDPSLLLGGRLDLSNDLLLTCIIGAVVIGIGQGVVVRQQATTGGTDIVAMIINKYRTVSYGKILIYSDFVIIGSALLVGMGISAVIYGYVMTAVVGYTVDMIMAGNQQSSQVFIVTHDYEKMAQAIVDNVHRGVTLIDSQGWYSKKESKIVMVVCRKRETSMILKFVKTIDPEAFMTVGSVMGVYGKGFQTIGKG